MDRRKMLCWTGAAGVAVLAGCISEDQTPEPTAENDTPEEGDDPGENNPTADSADSDLTPIETVEAFVAALDEGNPEALDSYLHPESPLTFQDSDFTDADETGLTVKEAELVKETDGEATVEFLLTVTVEGEGSESIPQVVTLRRADDEWRVWKLQQDSDSTLVPQAVFSTDHDGDSLEITHDGGDNIPADELVVRGEGIEPTGRWSDLGGEASGEVDESPAVVAGDSLTVETAASYEINIVWQSSEEDRSATLLSASGASERVSATP